MTAHVSISGNLERIRERIAGARERAGRSDEVALVAVSKTVDPQRIEDAYLGGQRIFGENRVQEGVLKIAALRERLPGADWHLIGHLQSNKARPAVETFSLIESVDSLPLAQRLDRLAGEAGLVLPILVEINVAGEQSKHGMSPAEFLTVGDQIAGLAHLRARGLMTVAPIVPEPDGARPVFRALRELRDSAAPHFPEGELRELSMGMSSDFEVAIEEGATMVRIGRALFGERSRG